MANHKSALKRARQDEKKRLRNKINKTKIKNTTNLARQAGTLTPEEAAQALREAIRIIDRSASKGTIHKKTASRRIARLSRFVFEAQAGQATRPE